MKSNVLKLVGIGTLLICMASCRKDQHHGGPGHYDPVVLRAAGDSNFISGTINQFRTLLGEPLNTTPDLQTTGRREVNWDGVPAKFTNNNTFPFDFFNSTLSTDPAGKKRGLILSPGATIFRVDSTSFSEIDPSYAQEFEAFSKKRLFALIGNVQTEVTFQIPGAGADAYVKGFGVIFSDVDNAGDTKMEFYNGTKSLGVYKAPARNASGSFSFLGVYFQHEKVTSVKITSGNGVLAPGVKDISNGGEKDLVVMDDFFYSEPLSLH